VVSRTIFACHHGTGIVRTDYHIGKVAKVEIALGVEQ
jgi:hypothetical protein